AGFAVSFATTRSLQRAIAALYGSMPRPARLGREVFSAEVARILAERDSLVLDADVLRRLDRIDCLVLVGDLLSARAFALGAVHSSADFDELEARAALTALFDPDRPLERQTRGSLELSPWRLAKGSAPEALEERARALTKHGALVLALERAGRVV